MPQDEVFDGPLGLGHTVSHGLWMNAYDYDAPTQLLKVDERNAVYADATQTVPKGVLYPLCSMKRETFSGAETFCSGWSKNERKLLGGLWTT